MLAALTDTFAGHHSLALQQTLYAMGEAVIDGQPEIGEVRFSMPNKHHFLVDLSPFGVENKNEVFHADDRPYGFIEGTIRRDDAPDPGAGRVRPRPGVVTGWRAPKPPRGVDGHPVDQVLPAGPDGPCTACSTS